MRPDIKANLKSLRLHGMALAWEELNENGETARTDSSKWLIEYLLDAEDTNREMRSISHQMKSARFPLHRDLAGFDFAASPVDRTLINKLSDLSFTDQAHNVVLIGGPGTGKTHLATALSMVAQAIGIMAPSQAACSTRFFSSWR